MVHFAQLRIEARASMQEAAIVQHQNITVTQGESEEKFL
jgi:hypothetical protein